jgi:hypothetical protein
MCDYDGKILSESFIDYPTLLVISSAVEKSTSRKRFFVSPGGT